MIWEQTKFDTQFFDRQRLRMDLLLLEEDTKAIIFRAATDWGIIKLKPAIKPEDVPIEEFAKEQDIYQLTWTD